MPTLQQAQFFTDLVELNGLDAAEFLVHRQLPVTALIELGCYDDTICARMTAEVARRGLRLSVDVRRAWYF
jgi:hypothetical protein